MPVQYINDVNDLPSRISVPIPDSLGRAAEDGRLARSAIEMKVVTQGELHRLLQKACRRVPNIFLEHLTKIFIILETNPFRDFID